jgi:hypothetical protein
MEANLVDAQKSIETLPTDFQAQKAGPGLVYYENN